MTREWFKEKNCTTLEISGHKSVSDDSVLRSAKIADEDVVKKFMNRIEKISAEGDMMKSFGEDAEFTDLIFSCASGKTQTIEIYNRMFKTPSTGFNSGKSELESGICADFDSILYPDLNKKIVLVKNLEVKFKDFSITYKGNKIFQDPHKTVSWTDHEFSLLDKHCNEKTFKIRSGQLPPAPYPIEVNGTKMNFLTYQTKEKERLYPDYFQITK